MTFILVYDLKFPYTGLPPRRPITLHTFRGNYVLRENAKKI